MSRSFNLLAVAAFGMTFSFSTALRAAEPPSPYATPPPNATPPNATPPNATAPNASPPTASQPWSPLAEKPTSGHEITENAGRSYCDYVRGIADSDRALQIWPVLFANAGLVNPSDITGGSTAAPPSLRLTAGASYSFGGLYRGGAIRDAAEADCATYRRFTELLAFIAHNKEGMSEEALLARAKVYDDAIIVAQGKVDSARARANDGRGTLDEVHALESRLDAMRAASLVAKRDAQVLAVAPASESKPLPELVAEYAATEKHAEEANAALRKSFGWDVTVRGGYDQVFGVGQKVPVLAMATATLNTGILFAGKGNEAAVAARPISSRWAIEGGPHPAVDAIRKLREVGVQESQRLLLVNETVVALEAREKAARALPNDKAQLFADYIFFDLTQARAEQAFLRAHVAHIESLTREHAVAK